MKRIKLSAHERTRLLVAFWGCIILATLNGRSGWLELALGVIALAAYTITEDE